jgi:hypothetical protein
MLKKASLDHCFLPPNGSLFAVIAQLAIGIPGPVVVSVGHPLQSLGGNVVERVMGGVSALFIEDARFGAGRS